jgi:hypothetical protein
LPIVGTVIKVEQLLEVPQIIFGTGYEVFSAIFDTSLLDKVQKSCLILQLLIQGD